MKQNLLKTMLVSTALVAGTMGVWADEVQLQPTDDTYLDFSKPAVNYGEEKALLAGTWTEMWTNATPGLKKFTSDKVVLMKFNVKDYVGKITGATLKVTGTNSNDKNRDVRLGYFDLNSWDEKTVTASSSQMVTRDAKKLNIHPFNCAVTLPAFSTNKEYAFSTNNLLEYLNNNADADGNVSLIIYGIGQECSLASKESDTKPSLILEYSAAKLYSVDFSESNGVTPEVKVYSDEACSTEVSASALTAGTKYYYVATLAGYEDYKGEFTVASENPSVSFTMVKKPVFAYKVNLVDEANNVLKTVYENDEAYEGLEVNYSYPKYLTDENGKVTYVCSLSSFNSSVNANKDAVTSVKYNEYKGTAYFVEAENVINKTKEGSANYSSGAAMRGFDKNMNLFTVPETGVYRLSYAVCSNNMGQIRQFFVYADDDEIVNKGVLWSVNDVIKKGTMTEAAMTFNEGTVIKAKGSDTNIILDYILLEKVTSEDVAVSSVKFATYVPVINVVAPAGVKVYTAKVNEDKSAVVLTEVSAGSVIAKGTPVLVGAEAGSYTFEASAGEATTVADNDLKAAAADTKGDGATIYALVEQDGKAVFAPLKEGVAVSVGHAYLELPAASATRFYSIQFGGETTGINEVNAAAKADGAYYTLQGVKTSKAAKGIYIHNGKKVVIK